MQAATVTKQPFEGELLLGIAMAALCLFSVVVAGKPNYNMAPVKVATVAAVVWGLAGLTVGVIIALQLTFPVLNPPDLPWLSFSRLRPLHTSAVIFAFGGNVLVATSFYVVQRT